MDAHARDRVGATIVAQLDRSRILRLDQRGLDLVGLHVPLGLRATISDHSVLTALRARDLVGARRFVRAAPLDHDDLAVLERRRCRSTLVLAASEAKARDDGDQRNHCYQFLHLGPLSKRRTAPLV
ncbi:MAG: hypothetical protein ACOC1U_03270 [Spirochaetota bacterium]